MTILSEFIESERNASQRDHAPRAFTGWALERASQLDRSGARGLVSDLITASPLTRQAAFVVLAGVPLNGPAEFLTQLATNPESVGEAIRTHTARELIAAVYGVDVKAVPGGYLRALMRIKEPGVGDPLNDPDGYKRMWEILTKERHTQKAEALRYCGPIRSVTLAAIDALDPVLVHPEIVKGFYGLSHVEQANALVGLLRKIISGVEDRDLVQALRSSLSTGAALETFARKVLERADRLPSPPLPPSPELIPMTSAADLIALGHAMKNCAAKKVAEVALGLAYVYKVEHRSEDGTITPLAVELLPLSDGRWLVGEVRGHQNGTPPAPVLQDVLCRLQALGAVLPRGPLEYARQRDLARLLGVHYYSEWGHALINIELEEAV